MCSCGSSVDKSTKHESPVSGLSCSSVRVPNLQRMAVRKLFVLCMVMMLFSCVSDMDMDGPVNSEGVFHHRTVMAEGFQRDFIVYTPRGYNPSESLPAILAFHGGGGTAQSLIDQNLFTDLADERAVLMLYPQALPPDTSRPPQFGQNGPIWNDGSGRFHAGELNLPDLPFVEAMLDTAGTEFAIDENRIFATGFSNGASMSARAGSELPGRFRAVAPVSGALWVYPFPQALPLPMLYITGKLDTFNPLGGGVTRAWNGTIIDNTPQPPVKEFLDEWAELHSCSETYAEYLFQEGVDALRYEGCAGESEIKALFIDDHAHVWPGGVNLLPEWLSGPSADHLDASTTIMDFFERQ
jgi:polyhydroxybutyrate depolymerase